MANPPPTLSDDEFVVLSIAAEGCSMMALGRWEEPVKRLVALGYLRVGDKFNHFITAEGQRRWAVEEQQELEDIIDWNNALVEKRQKEAHDGGGDETGLQ